MQDKELFPSKWKTFKTDVEEKNQKMLREVVSHFKTYDYDAAIKILNKLDQSVAIQGLKYSKEEYKKLLPWSEDANLLHILAYYPCAEIPAYKKMIDALISLGIKPNAIGDGHCTTLMTAISRDNKVFFDYLLDIYGKEINYYCDAVPEKEACALSLAITQEDSHYVKRLLNLGDLEIDERTVHFAVKSQNQHSSCLSEAHNQKQKETIGALQKKIKELEQKIESLEKDKKLADEVRNAANFKIINSN